LIYDDDDSGEIADVVCFKEEPKTLSIELYHCKFSGDRKPGARIDDLYSVCGQAQKCINWIEKIDDIFRHLQRREPRSSEGQEGTRFEVGDRDILAQLGVKSRALEVKLSVFVVQPGLSKTKVSPEQLELLSVTENYLMETYMLPFVVIASP
jgi:hypothetical protein